MPSPSTSPDPIGLQLDASRLQPLHWRALGLMGAAHTGPSTTSRWGRRLDAGGRDLRTVATIVLGRETRPAPH